MPLNLSPASPDPDFDETDPASYSGATDGPTEGDIAPPAHRETNGLANALGHAMLAILAATYDTHTALRFARSITEPTSPGTSDRALQDRVWSLLTARLGKLAGESGCQ